MRNLTFFLLIIISTFLSFPLSAQETDNTQFRSATAAITDQLYFSLTSNTDGSFDIFYLNFSDSYSEIYQGVEDALKMTLYYKTSPAVWTISDEKDRPLFINGLPMKDNRTVRVGFSLPKPATYTFSMVVLARQDLRSIVLIDHVTNDTIDLLKTSTYQFTSMEDSVLQNTTRFSFLINAMPTAPESISMSVADSMLISGPMRSDGAIHVFADAGRIDIDSAGTNTVLMTDTIILYSNNTSDGLLRNLKKAGGVKGIGTNQPKKVIIRKYFDEGVYTYFSLPIPVTSSNVQMGSTATTLVGGTNYWVYAFDAQRTSDTIQLSAWKELNYPNGFKKGIGYLVWYENAGTGGNVDFSTTIANDIDTLFSSTYDKSNVFPVYSNTSGQFINPEVGDGWAFLGGLNSTTYTFNRNTITGYTGTIWYRDATDSRAAGSIGNVGFRQISLAGNDSVNLPPYTPFYVQEASSTPIGIFTSTPSGLSIESAQYRSMSDNNPIKDQLYFILSSDKDHSYDWSYLNFADNYVETYQGVEDALKMTTFYTTSPAIWSIQDMTNTPLFVNGLPMKDEREVRIGFSVPKSGNYRFTATALRQQDAKNVILVDNVTGEKVDLLQKPYSFSTEAVTGNSDRFLLFVNSSYTGTPLIKSSEPYAYAKDNLLTVKNLSEGNIVQVLDLTGCMVASGKVSGKEFSAALNQKGVYVVTVKGEKTIVLKVLNK